MEKLNAKQQLFINAYLIDLNGKRAAIQAGYSERSAEVQASRLLNNDKVKAEIDKAMYARGERTQITQDEVIQDLRELRDICMGRRPVKVTTIVKNAREGTAEPVEVEGAMFEPAAANKTLELLGRHLGLFNDKLELSGKLELSSMSEEDLRSELAALVHPDKKDDNECVLV